MNVSYDILKKFIFYAITKNKNPKGVFEWKNQNLKT